MSMFLDTRQCATHTRGSTVKAALVVSVALFLITAFGSAPQAQATTRGSFCTKWIAPNEVCYMPVSQANFHILVGVESYGWAGCVMVTGYYGEPISSWHCFPKEGYGGYIYVPNTFGYYRAAIKSTNKSQSVPLSGYWECCQG